MSIVNKECIFIAKLSYMKTFLVAVATAVVIAILTAIITKAYFTDEPELVYSITTPINTNFSNATTDEYLQVLTVKNNGNLKAERIIISINQFRGVYNVKKYSAEDEVTSKTNGSDFQITYPTLPPDGQFEILLRTNSTVNTQTLIVKSDSGKASSAFDKNNTVWSWASEIISIIATLVVASVLWYLIFTRGTIEFKSDK